MKVTYIGDVPEVGFDGHRFPQGEPVEYKGGRLHKLQANPMFDVEGESAPESSEQDGPDFDAMSKMKLEAYAREHLNIELDRRHKKSDLVEQVKAAYADA